MGNSFWESNLNSSPIQLYHIRNPRSIIKQGDREVTCDRMAQRVMQHRCQGCARAGHATGRLPT